MSSLSTKLVYPNDPVSPHSSHPGSPWGTGLSFTWRVVKSQRRLEWLSFHPKYDYPKSTQSPFSNLAPGSAAAICVDESAKLTAGFCMGHRKYKVQVLNAQPDCVLKAQAADQRCHDKREFEHYRACKVTLEFFRKLYLTKAYQLLNSNTGENTAENGCPTSNQLWISTKRKLQQTSQISPRLLINYKEQQNYRSRKPCFLLFHDNPLKLLHWSKDLNTFLVIK